MSLPSQNPNSKENRYPVTSAERIWNFRIGREFGSSLTYETRSKLSDHPFYWDRGVSQSQSEVHIVLPVNLSSLDLRDVAFEGSEYDIELTVTAKKKFVPGYFWDERVANGDVRYFKSLPPNSYWRRVKVKPDA